MARRRFGLLLCLQVLALTFFAFAENSSSPVPVSANLFRLTGTHVASGTEYLRIFTTAEPLAPAISASTADPQVLPTFTIECTQHRNKRTLNLYVNFGGISDLAFPEPFQPTDSEPFPPRNPTLPIAMVFEGYIKSKPFKRQWEQLPNGNLRYRNPGMGSGNLDDPRFFLDYLRSLPTLHVIALKPEAGKPNELYFHMAALLAEVNHAQLCQP